MPNYILPPMHKIHFHISSRTVNRNPFSLPLPEVWARIVTSLQDTQNCALVLMSNHYHWLVKCEARHVFPLAFELNNKLNLDLGDPLIQPLFNKHQINSCYRYIYQNPVRSNLTLTAQDYPFSTLYNETKNLPSLIPLTDGLGFKDEYKLMWINHRIA